MTVPVSGDTLNDRRNRGACLRCGMQPATYAPYLLQGLRDCGCGGKEAETDGRQVSRPLIPTSDVVMSFMLRCTPPSTTAQKKRLRVVNGKPVFFHGAKMKREESTWTALLAPYVPRYPMDGALSLSIRLVYPHLASTPKRDIGALRPKITVPDCDGAVKHLIDQLTHMGFIVDDSRVASLRIEKFHGPEPLVGIQIQIAPFVC